MERKTLVLILCILILGVIYYNFVVDHSMRHPVNIVRVIDGDTIELDNGYRVRLLGINTPERGMPLFDAATTFVASLVLNASTIELEATGTDRYGRILGYLFVRDTNINEAIVRAGYAHRYYYDLDRYTNAITRAEAQARDEHQGIWEPSRDKDCIILETFTYYDKGPNDVETLTLHNACNKTIDIIIKDDATHIFRETLKPGTFTRSFQNTFNDDADSLYIWDEDGKLITFTRYP